MQTSMNMKRIITACFCFVGVYANSQSLERSVTATSGNYFYHAGAGSLSFTVGECAIESFSSGNNKLTQGFQQPDTSEISFVEENNSTFLIEIFPNPVTQFLTIKNDTKHKFLFAFYDDEGRLIEVPKLKTDLQIAFDVSKLATGFYLLSISDTEKKTTATKIFIKH